MSENTTSKSTTPNEKGTVELKTATLTGAYVHTDPTDRWSERVKAMSDEARPLPYTRVQHYPIQADVQTLTSKAEECIIKRPLTSMVIAATAGAAVTALLAALVRSGRR